MTHSTRTRLAALAGAAILGLSACSQQAPTQSPTPTGASSTGDAAATTAAPAETTAAAKTYTDADLQSLLKRLGAEVLTGEMADKAKQAQDLTSSLEGAVVTPEACKTAMTNAAAAGKSADAQAVGGKSKMFVTVRAFDTSTAANDAVTAAAESATACGTYKIEATVSGQKMTVEGTVKESAVSIDGADTAVGNVSTMKNLGTTITAAASVGNVAVGVSSFGGGDEAAVQKLLQEVVDAVAQDMGR